MSTKRFILIFVIPPLQLLTIWIVANYLLIDKFTLLSRPTEGSTKIVFAGKYKLLKKSGSGPIQGSHLTITSDDDGITISESNDSTPLLRHRFKFGKSVWRINDQAVEFQVDRFHRSKPYLPSFGRNREEGTMSLKQEGTLEIKTTSWEKSLILYLIPHYAQTQSTVIYQRSTD